MSAIAKVAAYLTPFEGQLACMRLGREGIFSRLENEELVTWLWHLSGAFRGVAVIVRSADRDRAAEILCPRQDATIVNTAMRKCAECGEILENDWDVCWQCGTNSFGHRDDAFLDEYIVQSQLLKHISGIDYLPCLSILVVAGMILFPPLVFLVAVLVLLIPLNNQASSRLATIRPEDLAATPAQPLTSDLGDERCRRALANAMFGFGWFPPLTIYSLWLLYDSLALPVGPKGRFWRRSAWAINVVSVIGATSFAYFLLKSADNWDVSRALHQFVREFLNLSAGLSRSTR
jgi:hypothetical protein